MTPSIGMKPAKVESKHQKQIFTESKAVTGGLLCSNQLYRNGSLILRKEIMNSHGGQITGMCSLKLEKHFSFSVLNDY